MAAFEPLRFPTLWPPPNCPVDERTERPLLRLPLVGWIVRSWESRLRYARHLAEVLIPLEQQIIEQLAARSDDQAWPGLPAHRRIAELIAAAVADEKFLAHVVLHPDDLAELLFWGAEDDLSPLIFSTQLESELGIRLSKEDWDAIRTKRMTVS